MIDLKYGGKNVPKYLLSHSVGALQATHMATMRPGFFKAMSMMAPYYTLYNEYLFEKYRFAATLVDKIYPSYRMVPFPTKSRPPDHIMHFLIDPLCFSRGRCPVRYLVFSDKLRADLINNNVHSKLNTPFLILLGG